MSKVEATSVRKIVEHAAEARSTTESYSKKDGTEKKIVHRLVMERFQFDIVDGAVY